MYSRSPAMEPADDNKEVTYQLGAATRSIIQDAEQRGQISSKMADELISYVGCPDFSVNQESFASSFTPIKRLYSKQTSDGQTFSVDYVPEFQVPSSQESAQTVIAPQLPMPGAAYQSPTQQKAAAASQNSAQQKAKTAPALVATLSKTDQDGMVLGAVYNDGTGSTLASFQNPQQAYQDYRNVLVPQTPDRSFKTDIRMRSENKSSAGVDLTGQEVYWQSVQGLDSNKVFAALDVMDKSVSVGYRKEWEGRNNMGHSFDVSVGASVDRVVSANVGYGMTF